MRVIDYLTANLSMLKMYLVLEMHEPRPPSRDDQTKDHAHVGVEIQPRIFTLHFHNITWIFEQESIRIGNNNKSNEVVAP